MTKQASAPIQTQIDTLLKALLSIPGAKIVTLTTMDQESFVIDIAEDGTLGYIDSHEFLFRQQLKQAFSDEAAALVIRQMLPMKVERETPSGEKIWIPKKNIYGIRIMQGAWKAITKDEMRQLHCIDAETGKPIPQERDVMFVNFPA